MCAKQTKSSLRLENQAARKGSLMAGTLWSVDDFRVILGQTQIDYDPNKDETNRKKHGYSLESAADFLTSVLLRN